MKDFIQHFITLAELLLGFICFYASLHINFTTGILNLAAFIIGIYIIIEACGRIDKLSGYGPNRDLNPDKKKTKKDK